MQVEAIRQAVGDAAQNVLEAMFFTLPEGDAEAAHAISEDTLRAELKFSGAWSGEFTVQAPFPSAREIAANFAGEWTPLKCPMKPSRKCSANSRTCRRLNRRWFGQYSRACHRRFRAGSTDHFEIGLA